MTVAVEVVGDYYGRSVLFVGECVTRESAFTVTKVETVIEVSLYATGADVEVGVLVAVVVKEGGADVIRGGGFAPRLRIRGNEGAVGLAEKKGAGLGAGAGYENVGDSV